jgi:phenylalanyl-tRNA synthetase alpha subunit
MSDIAKLEQQILGAVTAAGDEPALEAVRVAALGKSGSITALLKTLGTLTPDERKTQGPLINGLKDRVNAALAMRREAFKDLVLQARLNTESIDVTLPVREAPFEIGRVHPITQVIDDLPIWALRLPKAPISRPTITISPSSISRKTIRHARCTTRSSSIRNRTARGSFYARTPRRCRCARC